MFFVDWKVFAARFSGCEQLQFERMALLHFCHSLGAIDGIGRNVNHANLETDPVSYNGAVIGFQAKYYADKISTHKDEIISSIEGAKRRYPCLTKIRFYINLDHTENSRNPAQKAQYLADIDAAAQACHIDLEWMTAGNLEVALNNPTYSFLTSYFFAPSIGLRELIEYVEEITTSTLAQINVLFHGLSGTRYQCLDRTQELRWVAESAKGSVSIIHGRGGVGKSAIMRMAKDRIYVENNAVFYMIDAGKFLKCFLPEEMIKCWKTTLPEFLKIHNGISQKVLVIDSFEHLEGNSGINDAVSALKQFLNDGWIVFCTVRTLYAGLLKRKLLQANIDNVRECEVLPASVEFVQDVLDSCGVKYNQWSSISKSLCIPMYLDLYLKIGGKNQIYDSNAEWRDALWNGVICGDDPVSSVGSSFISMVEQRLKHGFVDYERAGINPDDVSCLLRRDVIYEDHRAGNLKIAHDIYEEWALEKIIMRKFRADKTTLLDGLGSDLTVRRAFRQWMYDGLHDESIDQDFVLNIISSDYSYWYDEVVVVLLQWNNLQLFLSKYRDALLQNEAIILNRFIAWASVVGRERKKEIPGLNVRINTNNVNSFLMTEPSGMGWQGIFAFCLEVVDLIPESSIVSLIDALEIWTNISVDNKMAQDMAACAVAIARRLDQDRFLNISVTSQEKLARVLSNRVKDASDIIAPYLDEVLTYSEWETLRFFGFYARQIITKSICHSDLICKLPRQTERIFTGIVWKSNAETDLCSYSFFATNERRFGLDTSLEHVFRNRSAYQTPVLFLLLNGGADSLNLTISFLNKFFENFVQETHRIKDTQKVSLEDGKVVELYGGIDFWAAHRVLFGSLLPNVVICVLMALEAYLLRLADKGNYDELERTCLSILGVANNVAVAGVLATVVLKCYKQRKLLRLALVLFSCREFFKYDLYRASAEIARQPLPMIGSDPLIAIMRYEREESNKLPFRKEHLEFVAAYLQLVREGHESEDLQLAESIWGIFDRYYSCYEKLSPEDQAFKSRVDMREIEGWVSCGDNMLRPITRQGPDVEKMHKESEEALKPTNVASGLINWAVGIIDKRINTQVQSEAVKAYNANPSLAIIDVDGLIDQYYQKNQNLIVDTAVPQACAALLSKFNDCLDDEHREKFLLILGRALRDAFTNPMSSYSYIRTALFAAFARYTLSLQDEEMLDMRVTLLILLTISTTVTFWGENDVYTAISEIDMTPTVRDNLIVDFCLFRTKVLSKAGHDYIKDPLSSLLSLIKEDAGILSLLTDTDHERDLRSLPEDVSIETKIYALLLLDEQNVSDEYISFIQANLPKILCFLYERNRDEGERLSIRAALRLTFLRKFSTWLLLLKGQRLDETIKLICSIPGVFDSSDLLDELAIRAEFVAEKTSIAQYWQSFLPYVVQRNPLWPSFLFSASYWSPNGNTREGKCIDEKLIAVFKQTFDMLQTSDEALALFASFFSVMGIKFALDGLIWIGNTMPRPWMSSRTKNVMDNFVYTVFEYYREKILADKNMYEAMLKILDYQVANKSMLSFQIRESL